jgi:hypothetical protein
MENTVSVNWMEVSEERMEYSGEVDEERMKYRR